MADDHEASTTDDERALSSVTTDSTTDRSTSANASDTPGSDTPASDAGPSNRGRAALKSALLWGVVAALAFLVLVQGYQLLEFGSLPVGVVVVATLAVLVVTTGLTYVAGP